MDNGSSNATQAVARALLAYLDDPALIGSLKPIADHVLALVQDQIGWVP